MKEQEINHSLRIFWNLRSTALIVPILFHHVEKSLGVGLKEILQASAIATIVGYIFEVPAGMLADRFGYRRVISFSLLLQLVSVLAIVILPNSISYYAYLLCITLAANCLNGADQGFLHQIYAKNADYNPKAILAKLNSNFYAQTAVLLVLGSFLYLIWPKLPFIIQAFSFAISLSALHRIPVAEEYSGRAPQQQNTNMTEPSLRKNSIWKFFVESPSVIGLAMTATAFGLATSFNHKTFQHDFMSLLPESGIVTIGVVYALGNVASTAGLEIYRKTLRSQKSIFLESGIIIGLLISSFALMGLKNPLFVVAGFLLVSAFKALSRNFIQGELSSLTLNRKGGVATLISGFTLVTALAAALAQFIIAKFLPSTVNMNFFLSVVLGLLSVFGVFVSLFAIRNTRPEKILLSRSEISGKSVHVVRRLFKKSVLYTFSGRHCEEIANRWAHAHLPHPKIISKNKNENMIEVEYKEGHRLNDIPASRQEVLLEELCDRLQANHSTALDSYPYAHLPFPFAELKTQIDPGIASRFFQASMLGLVHGDLHSGNILVNRKSYSAIDWDNAGLGYVWYDWAVLLTCPGLNLSVRRRVELFRGLCGQIAEFEIAELLSQFTLIRSHFLNTISDQTSDEELRRRVVDLAKLSEDFHGLSMKRINYV